MLNGEDEPLLLAKRPPRAERDFAVAADGEDAPHMGIMTAWMRSIRCDPHTVQYARAQLVEHRHGPLSNRYLQSGAVDPDFSMRFTQLVRVTRAMIDLEFAIDHTYEAREAASAMAGANLFAGFDR